MAHGIIWKYTDADQEVRLLIGHPGTFSDTPEEAVSFGREVIESLQGYSLEPLAVVETDADLDEDIYDREELYLGADEDQVFFDVAGMSKWSNQSWWPAEYR